MCCDWRGKPDKTCILGEHCIATLFLLLSVVVSGPSEVRCGAVLRSRPKMSDGKETEEGVVHVQRDNAFQVSQARKVVPAWFCWSIVPARHATGSDEGQEEGTRAGSYLPNSCAYQGLSFCRFVEKVRLGTELPIQAMSHSVPCLPTRTDTNIYQYQFPSRIPFQLRVASCWLEQATCDMRLAPAVCWFSTNRGSRTRRHPHKLTSEPHVKCLLLR